jgi:RNA polymerase sigma factor (sigma-70 family)
VRQILKNNVTQKERRHPSAADAVAAFYSEGWREQLAASLRAEFCESLGHDAILDAVDSALETALTRLRPEPNSEPPVYSGRMLFALARTIAWRRMRDQVRRNGKWAISNAGVASEFIARIPDRGGHDPEEVSLETERAEQIREAAAGLDDQTLLVISLFHVEGFKKPQIQRLLGLSEHAVRTRLRRGNEYLLEKYLEVEAGQTCEAKAGLLRLAFDLAKGSEARGVRAHIGHCRECARRYRRALAYRRSVAGLAPVPVVCGDGTLGGIVERVPQVARDCVARVRNRLAERFAWNYRISPPLAVNSLAYGGAKSLALCAACVALATGSVASVAGGSDDERGAMTKESRPAVSSGEASGAVPPDTTDHVRLARAASSRDATRRESRPRGPRLHRSRRRTAFAPASAQRQLPLQPQPVAPPPSASTMPPSASGSPSAGQPDEFFAP